MKKMKQFLSVLLVAVMMLAMSVTAFAVGDDSADDGADSGATYSYEIYQIFTGDFYNGILSNVKWGENGTGKKGEAVASGVLEALKKVSNATSDTAKLEEILKYAKLTDENNSDYAAYKTVTKAGNPCTVTGLPDGYYLVKDASGSNLSGNDAYTLYVVQVVDNTLTIDRKSDIPEVEKKIVEGSSKKEANEASIGETVDYEITGTLPDNLTDYNTYYYAFTDTLSKGLTYKENSLEIKVNNVDLTKYFYTNVTNYDENKGTTITAAIQDLLALNLLTDDDDNSIVSVDENSKIVITYTATLNEKAVIAGAGNENTVVLNYSNDPNESGTGTTTPPDDNPDEPTPTHPTGVTPESEVVTYTTGLTITKVDEDQKVLTGAQFTLTGNGVKIVLVTTETFTEDDEGEYWKLADGSYTTTAPTLTEYDDEGNVTVAGNEDDYDSTTQTYKKNTVVTAKGEGKDDTTVTGMVGTDGKVTFTGLGAGEYTITETITPDGYNTIAPIEFTVSWSKDDGFKVNNNNMSVTNNMLYITIVNEAGSLLPSTGGMGTTILYILGSVLVVGAGILLVVRRRMNSEK